MTDRLLEARAAQRVYRLPKPLRPLLQHYYRRDGHYDAGGYLHKHVLSLMDAEMPEGPHADMRLDLRLASAIGCDIKELIFLRLANDDAPDDGARLAVLEEFVERMPALAWQEQRTLRVDEDG
ncbi:MAG: hypothetical protein HN396_04585 [Gemmatimonadales bacterium]|jgi:hypothetical protein|nr:hypothetical protein [Gemmatimonadales bacterium]